MPDPSVADLDATIRRLLGLTLAEARKHALPDSWVGHLIVTCQSYVNILQAIAAHPGPPENEHEPCDRQPSA